MTSSIEEERQRERQIQLFAPSRGGVLYRLDIAVMADVLFHASVGAKMLNASPETLEAAKRLYRAVEAKA